MGMVSRLGVGMILAVSLTGCCCTEYYGGYGCDAGYHCGVPTQNCCQQVVDPCCSPASVQNCCPPAQGWHAPADNCCDPCGTSGYCGHGHHGCCLLDPLIDLVQVLHCAVDPYCNGLCGHHGHHGYGGGSGCCDPCGTYPAMYSNSGSGPCCSPSGVPMTPQVVPPSQQAPVGPTSALPTTISAF